MNATTVSPNNIGELILEELPEWHVGICRVEYDTAGYIVIYGEGDHPVGSVNIDMEKYRKPGWDIAQDDVVDTEAVADRVNEIIEAEHDRL